MHRYLEVLRRYQEDLERNLDRYLKALREVAEKYGGRAYLFGSYLRGERIAASDVDVLLEVPQGADRFEVLHEARRRAPNPKLEIHVLNESEAWLFKRLVKELKAL
jgi:predicted nucleotidyltransferase